mmetsp:Transcript_9633/g.15535  ORF Transcript_9633/g.15535 Transcript_9633/m.15535 type:complete len:120 (-) Transcript_9633:214-573(-)
MPDDDAQPSSPSPPSSPPSHLKEEANEEAIAATSCARVTRNNARLALKRGAQKQLEKGENGGRASRRVRIRGVDPQLLHKFGKKIYDLRNMGFRDNKKIVAALSRCNGDLRVALESLLR